MERKETKRKTKALSTRSDHRKGDRSEVLNNEEKEKKKRFLKYTKNIKRRTESQ